MFEGNQRPIDGKLLCDSGYMRDWLFTPIVNPATPAETSYNDHHSSARAIIEETIGVLKIRWGCLRRLRLDPKKVCRVIKVCVLLNNQARFFFLNLMLMILMTQRMKGDLKIMVSLNVRCHKQGWLLGIDMCRPVFLNLISL